MSMAGWATSGTILAIMLALFGYVVALTQQLGGVKERMATVENICKSVACISDLTLQVDRLVYRQELADKQAAAGLHSPTHHERDSLVDELLAGRLDAADLERVIELLQEAQAKERLPDKRFWALQLLQRAQTDLRGLHHE
jgi:hypothetical protein